MGKGDFGVPWEYDRYHGMSAESCFIGKNGKPIIWADDNDICAETLEDLERIAKCVSACDGIPDPEKTIPMLIDIAKCCLKLDPACNVLIAANQPNMAQLLEYFVDVSAIALKGVSDD